MHDRNGDPVLFQFIYFIDHILADMLFFFFREFGQGAVSTLSNRINDLLYMERFQAAILFDDLNISLWSVCFIQCRSLQLFFYFNTHLLLSSSFYLLFSDHTAVFNRFYRFLYPFNRHGQCKAYMSLSPFSEAASRCT